jgi:hypothetical protein
MVMSCATYTIGNIESYISSTCERHSYASSEPKVSDKERGFKDKKTVEEMPFNSI